MLFAFLLQIHSDDEREINEGISSVISQIDEVDEIDENHAESNDAFAAYVMTFDYMRNIYDYVFSIQF